MRIRGIAQAGRLTQSLALILLLQGAGCIVEKPAAPSFETTVYVPLGVQRTTGLDLLQDSEYIGGDSSGVGPLAFVLTGEVREFQVGSLLDLDLPDSSFSFSLQSISVTRPADSHLTYSLSTLYGPLPPGTSAVIPPFSFSGLRRQVTPQESFQWMRLSGGEMRFDLVNRLSVPLGPPGDDALRLRIWDRVSGGLIQEFTVDRAVQPGTTMRVVRSIAGLEFHNLFEVEVGGHSPGSSGVPVPINDSQGLDVVISFSSLFADSLIAQVPGQQTSIARSMTLPEDLRLEGGLVLDGTVALALRNELPLTSVVTVTFPEILRLGLPIERRFTLPAAIGPVPGAVVTVVDFAGAELQAPPGELLTDLRYLIAAQVTGSGGATVSVGTRQAVRGGLSSSVLRFQEVRGTINQRRFQVARTETSFDPPAGIEELQFERASLSLELESTVGLDSQAEAALEGIPADGGPAAVLPLRFSIPAGEPGAPASVRVVVDETNSPILDLIRAKPHRMALTGSLLVGGNGLVGTVRRSDFVRGRYTLTAPLRGRIGRITHRSDPFRFTVPQEDQDRIREDLISALARGQVENHFPAGLTARLVFAAREQDLESDPDVVLDSILVAPGACDPGTGRVIRAAVSPFEIAVDPEDIGFFARSEVFAQVVLTAMGPEAEAVVEVTALDFVDVKAILEFRMKVAP